MAPIQCARCGNEDGPFGPTPKGPVCEDCLDELENER